jgi:phage FluMu protein Com
MAICPHCKKQLNTSTLKTEESFHPSMKNTVMVSCAHCDQVLGFAPSRDYGL